jgi:hypothetical protein
MVTLHQVHPALCKQSGELTTVAAEYHDLVAFALVQGMIDLVVHRRADSSLLCSGAIKCAVGRLEKTFLSLYLFI